jgi:hypothetical protein
MNLWIPYVGLCMQFDFRDCILPACHGTSESTDPSCKGATNTERRFLYISHSLPCVHSGCKPSQLAFKRVTTPSARIGTTLLTLLYPSLLPHQSECTNCILNAFRDQHLQISIEKSPLKSVGLRKRQFFLHWMSQILHIR